VRSHPFRMSDTGRSQFGKRIRQLRLAKGWSQEEPAARSGLHPTYIGGIERGERNLGLNNLLKLARALDEHPSTLFSDF
jgi:transcriptional regulator with XRE-family HTH domain